MSTTENSFKSIFKKIENGSIGKVQLVTFFLFLSAAFSVMILTILFSIESILQANKRIDLLNLKTYRLYFFVNLGLFAICSSAGLWGLYLQKRFPQNRLFVHLGFQLIAVWSMLNSSFIGMFASPIISIVFIVIFVGLMFGNKMQNYASSSTILVFFVLNATLTYLGHIPVFPLFNTFHFLKDPFGAKILVFIGIVVFTSVFFLTYLFVYSLLIEIDNKKDKLFQLSNKLSKYLSPQVYDSIFKGEKEVRIDNQRKPLTVFFSDIVGFTSKTENADIQELTLWLNDYLEDMTNIALRYDATVDKFIGDAVMVFFGDPKTQGVQKDAINCVFMAREMQKQAKQKGIQIRIGINTGECIVGNFGSEKHMEYTIIGKAVNLAARLESSSEPDRILISQETYELVRDVIPCRKREPIRVKGIAKDLQTYWVQENTPEDRNKKGIAL
ncbi:MAG: adenylate/guanylate cyclase domain-containing protein [Bacteroidota bacterium]